MDRGNRPLNDYYYCRPYVRNRQGEQNPLRKVTEHSFQTDQKSGH